MRILVDMDGTIADWGERFDRVVAQLAREGHGIPYSSEQRSFDLKEGLDAEDQAVIDLVMDYPGFYASIRPILGASMALHEMLDAGHDVAIVTSPWITNPTCVTDKVLWVEEHLGTKWLSRLIITKDKTRIAGDILIDDKPEVLGAHTPEWEHVHFEQPYNRDLGTRRVLRNWMDWQSLISLQLPEEPNSIIQTRWGFRYVRCNEDLWRLVELSNERGQLLTTAQLKQTLGNDAFEIVGVPARAAVAS